MTAEKYASDITRKIKCSSKKRREIKEQLLSDIAAAQENGEPIDEIIRRMGSVTDIAKEFNENLPPNEKKKYRFTKIIAPILICAVLILTAFASFVYWFIPKTSPMGTSGIFTKEEVEAEMKETVSALNLEDYASLKENAIPAIRFLFNQESMADTKSLLSDDWGAFLSFGSIYTAELKQQGQLFAVGQIEVFYENITVIFTITFDDNMQIAGLYMKE